MFQNNFPCPGTIVPNYGSTDISVGASPEIHAWFYPNSVGDGDIPAWRPVTLAGPTSSELGVNLDGATANRSAAGMYILKAPGSSMAPNPEPAVCIGLFNDSLTNPFTTGAGVEARCETFGIRVTFIGKLSDTEGYVDFVQPYERPQAGDNFNKYRKDMSFKRHFFGDARSTTYVFQPTCDDVSFSKVSSAVSGTSSYSRLMMKVGGLASGDKIQVEYISVYSYTGSRSLATQKPLTVSPHATHLANSLVMGHGAMNKQKSLLAKVASGDRLTSVASFVRTAAKYAPQVISDVQAVGKAGMQIAKVIGSLM
jgi:hypothetical protein